MLSRSSMTPLCILLKTNLKRWHLFITSIHLDEDRFFSSISCILSEILFLFQELWELWALMKLRVSDKIGKGLKKRRGFSENLTRGRRYNNLVFKHDEFFSDLKNYFDVAIFGGIEYNQFWVKLISWVQLLIAVFLRFCSR